MSDYTVEETVHFMFTTRRFSTGAPFALSGGVISAYENESLTQITAGITLGADHDGVTGLNLVTVVATGANGFEAGKDYHLVITTGTVDSVSVVGEIIGRFTLSRSAAAVDLANGTDGLGAIKTDTAAILVDTGTTLDARIPAALVGGRIDATVDATGMEAGAIDAILDDTIGDSTITVRQALKVMMAALAGKLSGAATTTVAIRNVADNADVITATVDADGNRTAVTLSV